ncbi:hypothetical protein AKO1_014589 [Acrasis kona]|uniref:EGF-like domain-containing protein n=1 Tax=Acrasis kona TaxID=1008807 RepID=A0AAW2Z3R8_9EUKA
MNHNKVCNGYGSCVSPDQCNCSIGYSGSNCDSYTCGGISHNSSLVCSTNGQCTSFDHCECFASYEGHNCEQSCKSVQLPMISIVYAITGMNKYIGYLNMTCYQNTWNWFLIKNTFNDNNSLPLRVLTAFDGITNIYVAHNALDGNGDYISSFLSVVKSTSSGFVENIILQKPFVIFGLFKSKLNDDLIIILSYDNNKIPSIYQLNTSSLQLNVVMTIDGFVAYNGIIASYSFKNQQDQLIIPLLMVNTSQLCITTITLSQSDIFCNQLIPSLYNAYSFYSSTISSFNTITWPSKTNKTTSTIVFKNSNTTVTYEMLKDIGSITNTNTNELYIINKDQNYMVSTPNVFSNNILKMNITMELNNSLVFNVIDSWNPTITYIPDAYIDIMGGSLLLFQGYKLLLSNSSRVAIKVGEYISRFMPITTCQQKSCYYTTTVDHVIPLNYMKAVDSSGYSYYASATLVISPVDSNNYILQDSNQFNLMLYRLYTTKISPTTAGAGDQLIITASYLINSTKLICRLSVYDQFYYIPAQYIDTNHCSCIVPDFNMKSIQNQRVFVEITNDGVSYPVMTPLRLSFNYLNKSTIIYHVDFTDISQVEKNLVESNNGDVPAFNVGSPQVTTITTSPTFGGQDSLLITSSFSSNIQQRRALLTTDQYQMQDMQSYVDFSIVNTTTSGCVMESWLYSNISRGYIVSQLLMLSNGSRFMQVSYNHSGAAFSSISPCLYSSNVPYTIIVKAVQLPSSKWSSVSELRAVSENRYSVVCTASTDIPSFLPNSFFRYKYGIIVSQSNLGVISRSIREEDQILGIYISSLGIECQSGTCTSINYNTSEATTPQTTTQSVYDIWKILPYLITAAVLFMAMILLCCVFCCILIYRKRKKRGVDQNRIKPYQIDSNTDLEDGGDEDEDEDDTKPLTPIVPPEKSSSLLKLSNKNRYNISIHSPKSKADTMNNETCSDFIALNHSSQESHQVNLSADFEDSFDRDDLINATPMVDRFIQDHEVEYDEDVVATKDPIKKTLSFQLQPEDLPLSAQSSLNLVNKLQQVPNRGNRLKPLSAAGDKEVRHGKLSRKSRMNFQERLERNYSNQVEPVESDAMNKSFVKVMKKIYD